MKPSFGDQAHHALAVHAMKQWTRCKLPSEIVAIFTDNSRTMGQLQKMDVDEAVNQELGAEMFQKFLGSNEFKIACVCGIAPRIHMNSTCFQEQAVARETLNKRLTRKSLKLLAFPSIASSSESATKNNLASSVPYNNNSKSKHVKNGTKPFNKIFLNVTLDRKQRK